MCKLSGNAKERRRDALMPNGKKDTVKRSRYPFCARETPPYRGADAYAETVIPLPFAAPIRIEGKDSAVGCPHRIIACVAVDRPIRLRLELQLSLIHI